MALARACAYMSYPNLASYRLKREKDGKWEWTGWGHKDDAPGPPTWLLMASCHGPRGPESPTRACTTQQAQDDRPVLAPALRPFLPSSLTL